MVDSDTGIRNAMLSFSDAPFNRLIYCIAYFYSLPLRAPCKKTTIHRLKLDLSCIRIKQQLTIGLYAMLYSRT